MKRETTGWKYSIGVEYRVHVLHCSNNPVQETPEPWGRLEKQNLWPLFSERQISLNTGETFIVRCGWTKPSACASDTGAS